MIVATPMPRAERLAQIKALIAEGLTHRQIADALGITRSTVRGALNDPDGSKQRARRATYTGVCEDCGAETRSSGTSRPSPHCRACAHMRSKVWTREAIIDAVRRFAAENGRPPSATDWVRADPVRGYPPQSACHKGGGANRSGVFEKWADVIEAADFPRPRVGGKVVRERPCTCQDCGEEFTVVGVSVVKRCDPCREKDRRERTARYNAGRRERYRDDPEFRAHINAQARDYMRARYRADPEYRERRKAARRAWYWANRERILAARREARKDEATR